MVPIGSHVSMLSHQGVAPFEKDLEGLGGMAWVEEI